MAFRTLKRVYEGELPFDRTVQVSVTDRLEKEQILGRIPHNLRTLEVLLKRNRHDYRVALGKSFPKKRRRDAWQRLSRRRRRAVRLIEELGLRTQKIEQFIPVLENFSKRLNELQAKIRDTKGDRKPPEEREQWIKEYRNILNATQETPRSLGESDLVPESGLLRVPAGQTRAVRRQFAAGGFDRQEVPQSRA